MSGDHQKQIITAEQAPKAIGPYSHAVKAGHFIFSSGQLGLDPVSGALVPGGVEAETRQALLNLTVVLEAGGSGLQQVVKTTVFLHDINDFSRMNAVYAEFFTAPFPVRTTVGSNLLDILVEIDVVAVLPAKG